MKQVLLALFVLASLFQQATAQGSPVSATDFNNYLNAIKGDANAGKISDGYGILTERLNPLMNAQMTYMKNNIAGIQAVYSKDSTTVAGYTKTASNDRTQVQAAWAKAAGDKNKTQKQADVQKAQSLQQQCTRDSTSASVAQQNATKQLAVLQPLQATLVTETNAYNVIQLIILDMQSRKAINSTWLITNLQNFASTLH